MTRMTRSAWSLDGNPDWRGQALCGPDTAEWFDVGRPSLTETNLAALDMCGRCPVRQQCADDILAALPEYRRSVIAAGMVFGRGGLQVLGTGAGGRVGVPATSEHRQRRRAPMSDTTNPMTWDDIAGTPPTEESELPHGGTIRDLRISIGKLAQKGQDVFARTLLEGRTPGTPMDDATFELNHLAHGAAFHGFALVAVLRYLDEYCDPTIAQHAAAMVQEMGVDGDVGEWCEDIAAEIGFTP